MSDKNFEEKLKQHWREEADSIPVPDSLHPAKIEEMIDKKMEVPKKRTHKKLYAGITAAAACLALQHRTAIRKRNPCCQFEANHLGPTRVCRQYQLFRNL